MGHFKKGEYIIDGYEAFVAGKTPHLHTLSFSEVAEEAEKYNERAVKMLGRFVRGAYMMDRCPKCGGEYAFRFVQPFQDPRAITVIACGVCGASPRI